MGSLRPHFVGRRAELAALGRAWQEARESRTARTVTVEGAAGIGKTGLVEHFCGSLSREAPAPLIVSVSADQAGFRLRWRVMTAVLAELGRSTGTPEPARRTPEDFGDPGQVGAGLVDLFARPEGCVLFIDDAQFADPASLAALRHTATAVSGYPFLVVLAYQTGRSAPALEAGAEPPVSPRSWSEHVDLATHLQLQLGGLGVDDFLRLAENLGRPLPIAVAAQLHEHTGGSPLAWQIIRDVPIRNMTGVQGRMAAPVDVVRIVERLMLRFSPRSRKVIMAASVLGRRWTSAALHELWTRYRPAGPVDEAVDEAIDDAVDAGLLVEEPGGPGHYLRFVSTLHRDAAYGLLQRRQRRELHRIAAKLSPDDAVWHRVACDEAPDEQLSTDLFSAARHAYHQGRRHLAARYLQVCLERTPSATPHWQERLLHTVELLTQVGDLVAAAELEQALAACTPGPWLDYVTGYLQLVLGRPQQAYACLTSALHGIRAGVDLPAGAPTDLEARVLVQIAVLGIVTLDYGDISAHALRAVQLAPDDAVVTAFAWFCRALGLAMTGHAEQALDELASSAALYRASGLDALVARGIVRLWSDDLTGAHDDLNQVLRRAMHGEPLRVSQALAFLSEVQFRRGDLRDAVRTSRWAVDDARGNHRYWDFAMVHALACYPRAAMGRWDEAEELARTANDWRVTAAAKAYAAGSLAALAQARDDPQRMLQAAEEIEAAYDAKEPGTNLFGPLRADALSRLGRVEEAEKALQAYTDRFAGSGRRSALLAIARVRAQILLERQDTEGAVRAAGEALDHAVTVGLRLEEGRVHQLLARCRRAAGQRRAAERHLTLALWAFRRIGAEAYASQVIDLAAAWDPQAGPDRVRNPMIDLTEDEFRVINLHLEGHTNQQIVNLTGTPGKTVEGQLRRFRQRLEVGSLRELKPVLAAVEELALLDVPPPDHHRTTAGPPPDHRRITAGRSPTRVSERRREGPGAAE